MVPPSAAFPGPHHDPTPDLHRHPLPVTTIPTGTSWLRIYPIAYAPEYFDRSDKHRFNAPSGQFGTLYAGSDDHCAFIETLLRSSPLHYVSMADLADRGRARIEVVGGLRLVDLTGPGLAQIRADGRLTTGDYRVAQRCLSASTSIQIGPMDSCGARDTIHLASALLSTNGREPRSERSRSARSLLLTLRPISRRFSIVTASAWRD